VKQVLKQLESLWMNTMFVIKWETEPDFITDGTIVPLQVLTHEECLELMNTSEWTNNID
jgi:hypothetical protein